MSVEVVLLRTITMSVFIQCLHAKQGARERGISSSDFIQLKCDEEPTLHYFLVWN